MPAENVYLVEFPELFKDGNLFALLIEAGFERDAVVPGAIRQGARGWMNTNLKTRVENSLGYSLSAIDAKIKVPPPTRAVEPKEQDTESHNTIPDHQATESPASPEELEQAEPITLEALDMTDAARKAAEENNIHPVELLDRYGEDHRITKPDVDALLE